MSSRFAVLLLSVAGFALVCTGCDETGPDNTDRCNPACIPEDTFSQPVDTYPAWSPVGDTLAYTHFSVAGEPGGVWLMDLETKEKRFLTEGRWPAWSPDGTRLAFVRSRDIYTIEVASGQVQRLTNCGSCGHPGWSPDGEFIAFGAGEGFTGSEDSVGTWVMKPDGSEENYLLRGSTATWAPVGDRLVLSTALSDQEFPDELAVFDRVNGSIQRLTYNNREDDDPAWSPNGKHIAWNSNGEGDDPKGGLWVMNADGSNPHLLVRDGWFPAWSPDGTKIVYFGRLSPEAYDVPTRSLWIANADGSNARPLTRPEDYTPTP